MPKKVQKPSSWKEGGLHQVKRPTVQQSKYNKTEMLKQSQLITQVKGGKTDLSKLPEGVQKSVLTKQRIDEAIRTQANDADSIRERLNIQKKPLDLKSASIQKGQLMEKYAAARGTSKGISLDKLNSELKKGKEKDLAVASHINMTPVKKEVSAKTTAKKPGG